MPGGVRVIRSEAHTELGARVRRRRISLAIVLAFAGIAASAVPASAESLNAYRVEASAKNLKALADAGFDVTEGRDLDRGTIDVVGYRSDFLKLDAQRLTNHRAGAARRGAGIDPTAGATDAAWNVWTKYDAVPDDDKEQYTEQYERLLADHPEIVAERVTGTTYGGRDIIALQVTKDATGSDIPGRPAVLYNAMQHAREWLAGETCRRTLDYFVGHYGKGTSAGKEATKLVDNTELWFVCVNNPDGYEYTFTPGQPPVAKEPRRQRRQRRDRPSTTASTRTATSRRTGAATTTAARPTRGSETYRGPGPASEPETQAMEALFAEINPVFQKNDHTAASLLLYPQGVQQDTPSADHEIFTALAGDPFKPGDPRLHPGALGRALHHQRRLHRLGLQHAGHPLLHAGGHPR